MTDNIIPHSESIYSYENTNNVRGYEEYNNFIFTLIATAIGVSAKGMQTAMKDDASWNAYKKVHGKGANMSAEELIDLRNKYVEDYKKTMQVSQQHEADRKQAIKKLAIIGGIGATVIIGSIILFKTLGKKPKKK